MAVWTSAPDTYARLDTRRNGGRSQLNVRNESDMYTGRLAKSGQFRFQLARRNPDIRRQRRACRLLKLDDYLDRLVMAERVSLRTAALQTRNRRNPSPAFRPLCRASTDSFGHSRDRRLSEFAARKRPSKFWCSEPAVGELTLCAHSGRSALS